MNKIMVPQELTNQIVDLYNKGMTRKDIKKKLKVSFGDSVIKRILEENNIVIRSNPGAKKGGRKKQEVDKKLQNEIIDLYVKKRYGLDKIVRELNLPFSFDKVKSILKDNNVYIRNLKEAKEVAEESDLRKYSINDDYNLISHNGAWLLGFVAADGYLPNTKGARNRIVIGLSAIDKDVLELIKEELHYTGPIYEYESSEVNGKTYPSVSLSLNSKKLRQQFERFGIVNNKTFKIKSLPKIPEEYLIDYIRGYFDGDGSVFMRRNEINMGITSANKEFLTDINEYLHKKLPLKFKGNISPNKSVYQIKWGATDSKIIGEAFYCNSYLALPRKKNKFLLRK